MNDSKKLKSISLTLPQGPIFQLFIIFMLLIGAFYLGSLYTKVTYLEKQNQNLTQNANTQATGNQANAQQQAPPQASLSDIKALFSKNIIKIGDSSKKILFVEVADPSCPYCSIAAGVNPELNNQAGNQFKMEKDGGSYVPPIPSMKKLVTEGKAAFAYLYSPGHGNGEMGMKALYCAQEKGKFWEVEELIMGKEGYELMNDTIKNDKTKSQELADFLKSAIDPVFLKQCLDSGKYDARLGEDQKLALSIGIQGTPGFYVNDTLFAGAYSFSEMQSAVDAALK